MGMPRVVLCSICNYNFIISSMCCGDRKMDQGCGCAGLAIEESQESFTEGTQQKEQKRQVIVFLLCSWNGKLHVPGKIKYKLQGKSSSRYTKHKVTFPLQFVLFFRRCAAYLSQGKLGKKKIVPCAPCPTDAASVIQVILMLRVTFKLSVERERVIILSNRSKSEYLPTTQLRVVVPACMSKV